MPRICKMSISSHARNIMTQILSAEILFLFVVMLDKYEENDLTVIEKNSFNNNPVRRRQLANWKI